MLINWYPWLIKPYKEIIQQHQIGKAHHSILINTCRGVGVLNFLWAITRWLLCKNRQEIKSCGKCHSCYLMMSNNHPDWYQLKIKNNTNILGIDIIRKIIDKTFQTSQQNGEKIIWIPNISYISNSGICALLKILEEPPINTWFFIVNYNALNVSSTLRSRCFSYTLFPPSEKKSTIWLKKNHYCKNELLSLTALRITEGAPLLAKKIIQGNLWLERKLFFFNLENAIYKKQLFNLLFFFTKKKIYVNIYIDWLCYLLFDVVKWKYNLFPYVQNLDKKKFITYLSLNCTITFLDHSIQSWIICRHRLTHIMGINYELLLAEQLLNWEKKIFYNEKI
ncbi:DNA polymerase III subunit delta' [Buchnera aphidicola (Pemphigus obesinymphae)]|uniref:DNA polymerase III subunit delta' C-terminal domain-containing protein n=1 Tax=Buchnera aphidicola TaxID=9 RepID=UPI002237B0D6|nr:DNA polymerase III subunit delta' C-terminal domain-containing protein [Buchnera aphidicola]MCW5196601.1 DNA polymerase III subunit delta' [Buchnera aphidicola (Pemphigus obesinymphae)]